MIRKLMIAAAALLVLVACESAITDVEFPEPAVAAGSWAGSARWDALQGGGASTITSGSARATIFQSGAAVTAGSSWEVSGLFTGTLSGSIDDAGNFTGTTTVTVLAGPCQATASFGGKVENDHMTIAASFADPGSTPCAGAPVGLLLELGR